MGGDLSFWVGDRSLRFATRGCGAQPGDKTGAGTGQVPVHLQVAGDRLGGASAWAAGNDDDGFGQGGSEVSRVWVGSLDVFQQLHLELLDWADLDVPLLTHRHASHELALERTELGGPQWP